ncbi:MAG: preprotein translocase subunit SecG [Synergistetes bacterium]|nr:preprotein translocase subunit SecG [Synergistota bacterium]MCX8127952.1 preprotein translocase subunit SecG [Synergistota bacterium]MDW8192007.1 preprotein translocase subunit SecG [Synergistota bacterium]
MKLLIIVAHLLIAVVLISVIMFQGRKSSRFSGIFGGGTLADMSGGQRKKLPFLTKLTAILGIIFMVTSFLMVFYR